MNFHSIFHNVCFYYGCQWLCFSNILQNILFCVQQKKTNHTSLEPNGEEICCVNYPFKTWALDLETALNTSRLNKQIKGHPKANSNSLSNYFSTIYDIKAAVFTLEMTEHRTITNKQNGRPSTWTEKGRHNLKGCTEWEFIQHWLLTTAQHVHRWIGKKGPPNRGPRKKGKISFTWYSIQGRSVHH